MGTIEKKILSLPIVLKMPNCVFVRVESILPAVITSTREGSFSKYLLSTYCGPGTVSDSGETLKRSASMEFIFQGSFRIAALRAGRRLWGRSVGWYKVPRAGARQRQALSSLLGQGRRKG